MVFPGRRRGCSCSKNRRLQELHLSSKRQSERDPASNTLHLFQVKKQKPESKKPGHCTDCEHDLTSPIVNSTRRGSVSAKETRHGQVLCSKMWLFVSCAIQTVSDSNNTTISSASLTRDLKSDKLGVNDPQAISASDTGPEGVSCYGTTSEPAREQSVRKSGGTTVAPVACLWRRDFCLSP